MLGKGIALPQDIELILTDAIAMFFDETSTIAAIRIPRTRTISAGGAKLSSISIECRG